MCSQCGTRWNVRDRRRVWCPRCNGTLLAPSGPAPGRRVERPSDRAGAAPDGWATPRVAPRRGCRRDIAGSRCGPAPPRRRAAAGGPSARLRATRSSRGGVWWTTSRLPEQQAAAPRSGPSLAMVRATLLATMVVLGVAALVHVVRYALLIVNRIGVVEQGGGVRSDLAGRARQRRRDVHGRRQRGGADELADRPAGRGLRAPPARRSTADVGAAGGLPCAAGESGLGAGVRDRVGRASRSG